MDRRKFLAGVGAGAIGGSVLLGSGAFSRIESQRRVKVEVANDQDAYLGLDACPDRPNASYTGFDDSGHLEIEMSSDNPTEGGGVGVNSDSFTYFHNLFQICNQGKQPVAVWIDAEPSEEAADSFDREYEEYGPATFYVGDDEERAIDSENPELLQPGDCLCVGLRVVTKGLSEGDQLLEDDEIVIHADADTAADPPQGGNVWNQTQGTTYETIQAAEDDANEGDTIKVYPTNNPYEEMVEVDTDDLTIKGINRPLLRAPDDFDGPGGTPNIEVSASGVTIEGMAVDTRGVGGNVPGGIVFDGDYGEAIDNHVSFSDPGANGQGFIAGSGDSLWFEDNVVEDTVIAYWGEGDAEIYDNLFVGPKIDEALWSTTGGELTVEGNIFTDAEPGAAMVKFTEEGVTVNGETGAGDITNSVCAENTDVVDVEVAGTVTECNGNNNDIA